MVPRGLMCAGVFAVVVALAGRAFGITEVFWSGQSMAGSSWADPANWMQADGRGYGILPGRVPTAEDDVRIIETTASGFVGTVDAWFLTGGPGFYYGVDGFSGSPLTKSTYPEEIYGKDLGTPVIGPGVDALCKNIHGTGRMDMRITGGTLTIGQGDGLFSIGGISGIGPGNVFMTDGRVVAGTIGIGFGNTNTLHVSGGRIVTKHMGLGGGWGNGTLQMTGGVVDVTVQLTVPGHRQGFGTVQLDGGTLNVKNLDIYDPDPAADHVGSHVDVNDGILVAEGNQVEKIQGYIHQGWITAYEGNPNAALSLDYDITHPGKTTLKAVLYESAQAKNPKPANNTSDAPPIPTLSWTPGAGAVRHNIYFGSSEETLVLAATQAADANSYEPGTFTYGQTWYWRVDECDAAGKVLPGGKGLVWVFTVANYYIVDDFERYTDYEPNRVFDTWADGWDADENGSTAGYPEPAFDQGEHFLETANVHSGNQAMPLFYNNSNQAILSQVTASAQDLPVGSDWTVAGVKSLVLHFYGDPCNVPPEPMYVIVEDETGNSSRLTYPDANHIMEPLWHEWNIALSEFDDTGVDLTNVKTITIGIGDWAASAASGASGLVLVDSIRLYPPRCRVEYKPAADLTGPAGRPDCCVDVLDLMIMARDWLAADYTVEAIEPNQPRAWYKLDETGVASTVIDSSGNGRHATLHPWSQLGRNSWDPQGRDGGCLHLEADKAFGVTVPPAVFENLEKGITVTVWVKGGDQQPREDEIFYGENVYGERAISARCPWSDSSVTFITGHTTPNFTSFEAQAHEYKGQWNHYAFVKDPRLGIQRIYLNGELRADHASATSGLYISKFEIGWQINGAKKYIGRLDDFRIYDYAMSPAEIFHTMFEEGHYFNIDSPANLYDRELVNFRSVNFNDFAVMAGQWLSERLWP